MSSILDVFLLRVEVERNLFRFFCRVVECWARHTDIIRPEPFNLCLRDKSTLSNSRLRPKHIINRLCSFIFTRSWNDTDRLHGPDWLTKAIQVSFIVNLASTCNMVDSGLKFFSKARFIEKTVRLVCASVWPLDLDLGCSVRIIQIDRHNLLLNTGLELMSQLLVSLFIIIIVADIRVVLSRSWLGEQCFGSPSVDDTTLSL